MTPASEIPAAGAGDEAARPQVAEGAELARARRECTASLRDGERRTRALFQQAPGFMCILDGPEHVFAFANDAYRRMVGGRDVLGKPVREALPELEGQGFFELLDKAFRDGTPFIGRETPARLRRMPEGPLERIFVDFVYQPITDAAGKVTGVFVEGFENTDRVEAEAALRESEARYRSLFNAIDEGFCVVEALSVADGEPSDWRYIAANPALKVQSGIKNVVGHTIRGVIPNEAQSWIDTFDEILRTGEPLRFERGLVSQGRVLDLYAFRLEDETRRRVGVIFRDITTRKRAEQALRTSGERFRALVNASSDAVYRMSADWTEMRQLAGREFIADTPDPSDNWLEKYVPPDDQPHVMAAISEAIRIKSTFELEHRVRRIDGSLGWTFSRAIPLLDGQGNIVEWFGTASDITEQKRAEALRTAQNRILEMAIQDTPLGEALDELMRTVEAQSSAGMLGSILLLDDDGAHLRHGAAPSLPDGYTKAIDGTVIGPSVGSCGTAAFRKTPVYVSDIGTDPLWFGYRDLALSYDLRACWSTPILSGCGEVLGTFAMYYREPRGPPKADLELVDFVLRSASLAIEHKRAMHALHRMNETLEQRVSDALAERKLWADISESTDATICVLSAEFRFLAVNKAYMDAFESAYGVRPRVGNGLLALLAGQPHRQAAVKAVWKRALSGEAFTVVEELGDEGGPRPTYEVAYDALSDGNGRMIGAFQYGRDITERLRNQAELAATAERLRQAQRLEALGQLAGGIAHDFNNVIQAARAGAALIARRPDEAERVQSLARSIIEATERAAAVTRRLLTFSRRGDLRAEPVGADSLLAGMREILSHTLGTGIAVRVKTEAGLPPLFVDKAQLETVLVNVATNARDAMQGMGTLTFDAAMDVVRDGKAASRRVTLKAGAYVRLGVTDTGSGMMPEVLARASEPFFTTKEMGKGTGLGLSMARGFAEQSHGGLLIESAVGRGTTVTLWFPLAEERLLSAGARDGEAHSAAPGVARARLLLVDDDRIVREMLTLGMEAEGYAVLSAASGAEALSLLDAGEAVDLVISDLSMPRMDGVSVIRGVQRRRPHLPAILLTGFVKTSAGIDLDAGLSGPFTVLRKPVHETTLAEHVAMLLEGRGDARPSRSR